MMLRQVVAQHLRTYPYLEAFFDAYTSNRVSINCKGPLLCIHRNTPPSLWHSFQLGLQINQSHSPGRMMVELLNQQGWEKPSLLTLATEVRDFLYQNELSLYNDYTSVFPESLSSDNLADSIVVLDEINLRPTLRQKRGFSHLIEEINRLPKDCKILVKPHPKAGFFHKGFIREDTFGDKSVQFLSKDINPIQFFKSCKKVYTVGSQAGFEAIYCGAEVHTFGGPWYAGWGHTQDRNLLDVRLDSRSLDELFTVSYLLNAFYINPINQSHSHIFKTLDFLNTQKQINDYNRGETFCFESGFWRKRRLRRFLSSDKGRIHFVGSVQEACQKGMSPQSKIYVWGSKEVPGLLEQAAAWHTPIGRIEDGFLRSVGLGSDMVCPESLAVDATGIYYDPATPSKLEHLLQTSEFPSRLLERAQALRKRVIENKVSKYNVNFNEQVTEHYYTEKARGRKIILIASQVEDDASIRKGTQQINTNLDLLKMVRKKRPDDFIIYKVHPDVAVGNRHGGYVEEHLLRYCDAIEYKVNIIKLIELCDELHTLTSLSGFEALIRDKQVHTYGYPFYAGWGLTKDWYQFPNRTRQLSLDELFAATIILYPTYYNWKHQCFDIPENVLDRLIQKTQMPAQPMNELLMRTLLKTRRKLFRLYKLHDLKPQKSKGY
jgi:capsular polysaccharide export protein